MSLASSPHNLLMVAIDVRNELATPAVLPDMNKNARKDRIALGFGGKISSRLNLCATAKVLNCLAFCMWVDNVESLSAKEIKTAAHWASAGLKSPGPLCVKCSKRNPQRSSRG